MGMEVPSHHPGHLTWDQGCVWYFGRWEVHTRTANCESAVLPHRLRPGGPGVNEWGARSKAPGDPVYFGTCFGRGAGEKGQPPRQIGQGARRSSLGVHQIKPVLIQTTPPILFLWTARFVSPGPQLFSPGPLPIYTGSPGALDQAPHSFTPGPPGLNRWGRTAENQLAVHQLGS